VTPGAVTVAVLRFAQEESVDAQANLDVLNQTLNMDDAKQMIASQMAVVEEMIRDIETTGSYTAEVPGVGDVTLSADDLAMTDRILASYAQGMLEYLNADARAARVTRFSDAIEDTPSTFDPLARISEWAQETRRFAVPGERALGGLLGAVVSGTGLYIAETGAVLSGTVLAVVGGVLVVVAITGTAVTISYSANTFARSVVNETADVYEASREAVEVIKDGFTGFVLSISPLAVPRRIGDMFGIYSVGSGVNTFIEQTAEIGCSDSSSRRALRAVQPNATFCVIVLSGPNEGDNTEPPDMNTDGPIGAFEITFVTTGDGFTGPDPSRAQISLSGESAFPTISFEFTGVRNITLADSDGSLLYDLVAVRDENSSLVPIVSPLQYGDYSRPNTKRSALPDDLPETAPALQSGQEYSISVFDESFEGFNFASITFTVN